MSSDTRDSDKLNVGIYLFNRAKCRARLMTGRGIAREIHDQKRKNPLYFVYILLCDDGSYYTGYTSNLPSRFHRHTKGCGARYTKMRRPRKIVYEQRFTTRSAAMRRERQIKLLSHDEKHDLAESSKSRTARHQRKGPLRDT